jgi:hypothetical protein
MFTRNALSCLFVLFMGLASMSHARQSGPLISDLVDYQDIRAAIPSSTLDVFVRTVRPSPEQQTAAAALISGARADLSRAVNRHLRTVRDDPTLTEMQQSEAQVVKDVAVVERQILADLRSVLTSEQEELFPRFERAHRRTLLRQVNMLPMPVDLWRFFAQNNFDPAQDGSLTALLDKFDRDSDAGLVRQRKALKAYYASVRLGFDGTEAARERDAAAQRELRVSTAALERVQAAVVEPLLRLLPPAIADKLVTETLALASQSFDPTVSSPERFPVTREVLALNLTPDQQAKARSLINDAKSEALIQARSAVVERARYTLLDNDARAKVATTPINIYWENASKLRVRLSNDLLALLTSEQRADYDASDVVDPSSTSLVNDD